MAKIFKNEPFKIWGILNITPDSFYNNSRVSHKTIVSQAFYMLKNGADMLDIGAESSRPQAKAITWQEEWQRLKKPLKLLKKKLGKKRFSQQISIDTYKLAIVKKVLKLGVRTINDINGGQNKKILRQVARYNAQIVLMHKKGDPHNMQHHPVYQDVVYEVSKYLRKQVQRAKRCGIKSRNIIIDPGIGFGKNLKHNLQLLKNIHRLRLKKTKMLLGVSRKSFIGEILQKDKPQDRLLGSHSIHTIVTLPQKKWHHKADIIRVHDVVAANEIRKIYQALGMYQ